MRRLRRWAAGRLGGDGVSILLKPPHVVWVQKYVETMGDDGVNEYTKQGVPIRVPCYVQDARSWSDAEEYPMHGLQLKNLRVIFARWWPGDVHSHVFFDGYEFLTEGEIGASPMEARGRKKLNRVAHYRVSLYRFGVDEEGISLQP